MSVVVIWSIVILAERVQSSQTRNIGGQGVSPICADWKILGQRLRC
jgi:hypothetical protein